MTTTVTTATTTTTTTITMSLSSLASSSSSPSCSSSSLLSSVVVVAVVVALVGGGRSVHYVLRVGGGGGRDTPQDELPHRGRDAQMGMSCSMWKTCACARGRSHLKRLPPRPPPGPGPGERQPRSHATKLAKQSLNRGERRPRGAPPEGSAAHFPERETRQRKKHMYNNIVLFRPVPASGSGFKPRRT